MTPELRRISEADYPLWIQNLDLTFGFDYKPEEDSLLPILEFDRTFGHFASGRVVSTTSAFSLDLTVPGGTVACGGTTVVSVAPTHRRQGLLREIMTAHLDEVADRGEPIAALWASESEIYGRFGYGRASDSAKVTVNRSQPEFSSSAATPGSTRVINKEEAQSLLPDFHEQVRVGQPGMFKRSEAWWENRIFRDFPSRRSGYTANRWTVVEGNGGIEGYTRYRTKGEFSDDGHSAGDLAVLELFGTTPRSWASLWSFILNQDLMSTYSANLRSPADPIFDLLAGPRRARAVVSDGIWVRVIDVVKALQSRSYHGQWAGIIQLVDPLGYADGTFEVDVSPDGASVTATSKSPDVVLQVGDLGEIYLGRPALTNLGRAGRIEGDLGVLRQIDQAFTWDPQPWCPEIF